MNVEVAASLKCPILGCPRAINQNAEYLHPKSTFFLEEAIKFSNATGKARARDLQKYFRAESGLEESSAENSVRGALQGQLGPCISKNDPLFGSIVIFIFPDYSNMKIQAWAREPGETRRSLLPRRKLDTRVNVSSVNADPKGRGKPSYRSSRMCNLSQPVNILKVKPFFFSSDVSI